MRYLIFMEVAFIMCLSLAAGSLQAQDVVIDEDVNADTLLASSGPNRANYFHWYATYGLVSMQPEAAGADIIFGYSYHVSFGLRYKRRLTNWLAIGSSLDFGTTSYRLKQDSSKVMPNAGLHDKEVVAFSDMVLAPYVRINIGRRGNTLGNYLDLIGWGGWNYASKHFTKDKLSIANASGASLVETTEKRLVWSEPLNYGVGARIGIGRYAVYGKYRLSDRIIKTVSANGLTGSSIYPELPRLVVGFEMGLIF